MFSKLTFIALIAFAVAAPQHHTAEQFPAGVDPSKCPNFPICDNAALHNQQPSASVAQPQQQWNQPQPKWNQQPQQSQWNQPQPQSQWNQPQSHSQWNQPQPQQQWNQPQAQPSWNSAPYQAPSNHLSAEQNPNGEIFGPGGDKYPAGVNPQHCPNYPYCDDASGHGNAVPVPAPAPAPAPAAAYNERQYPAGVSPQSCPNFPYCH